MAEKKGYAGKMIVATKGGHYSFGDPDHSSRINRKEIREDLDESCRTLGTNVIDMYWLHRDDPQKPAEEIIDILEELKKEGRIRYYGFSNYRTERLQMIEKYSVRKSRKGSLQCPISGVLRESTREEIPIRTPRLWNFRIRNTDGTVRAGQHRYRFLQREWDSFPSCRMREYRLPEKKNRMKNG